MILLLLLVEVMVLCLFYLIYRQLLIQLIMILKYHKIGYHVYDDDTQLYISFQCKQPLEAI